MRGRKKISPKNRKGQAVWRGKERCMPALIVLLVLLQSACTGAPGSKGELETGHWSYTGDTGPDYWHRLDREYTLAKEGKAQSPVDVVSADLVPASETAGEEALGKLEFHYRETGFRVENNGHTIELIPADQGNYVTIDNNPYTLEQMHFHLPSEHTVDGSGYAMEAHLVHKDSEGKIAVLGILLVPGQENPALKELFIKLPREPAGETAGLSLDRPVNPADLFPSSRELYRYDGSLTTPPCTEGVSWSIFTRPVELSNAQISAFRALYSGNARPVQKLYGRKVYLTE
ncbi:MAG: carbonic anhydrase family protein [Treponema sp.]|nr:carbonic anhydrase family protein [Treponema sp.]